MTLEEEWAKLQADAKARRAGGFMGQVVLPGEGSFEEFKRFREQGNASYGQPVATAIGTATTSQPVVNLGLPAYNPIPDPTTLTGAYEIATGTEASVQPVLGTVTNADVQPAVLVETGDTSNIPLPNNPMDGMTPEEQQQFLLNTLRTSDAGLNNMAEQQDLSLPKPPETPQTTQEALEAKVAQTAINPQLTTATTVRPTELVAGAGEFVTGPEALTTGQTTPVYTAPTTDLEVTTPIPTLPPVVQTATNIQDVTAMDTITGKLSADAIMTAPQGTVSSQSLAQAATAELDERATVQYQLSQLTQSIEEGRPLPAWAAPTARKVNALMQQRGLGASSMASAAMTQALIESGVQIAATDADKFATIQLANLNNRQQAALQNASVYAAMDTANLNARLTAAVNNAKAFLTLDMANLDNAQKTATLNYNAEIQALFTDTAAENATRQLNAKNQMQVDEFFTELAVQTETANKNRVASMNQFNVSQANAMAQFDASLNDQREKFNSTMSQAIEQSNAVWRREINTANTAAANEAARINVQNLLNLNQTAQAQLWQQYRDEAAWAMTMSDNELRRAHEIGMLAMQADINKDMYDKQFKDKVGVSLGEAALNIIFRPKKPVSSGTQTQYDFYPE